MCAMEGDRSKAPIGRTHDDKVNKDRSSLWHVVTSVLAGVSIALVAMPASLYVITEAEAGLLNFDPDRMWEAGVRRGDPKTGIGSRFIDPVYIAWCQVPCDCGDGTSSCSDDGFDRIRRGMSTVSGQTNIRFVDEGQCRSAALPPTQYDGLLRVKVCDDHPRSDAQVGRDHNLKGLFLRKDKTYAAEHELGHTLGFLHEMNRTDIIPDIMPQADWDDCYVQNGSVNNEGEWSRVPERVNRRYITPADGKSAMWWVCDVPAGGGPGSRSYGRHNREHLSEYDLIGLRSVYGTGTTPPALSLDETKGVSLNSSTRQFSMERTGFISWGQTYMLPSDLSPNNRYRISFRSTSGGGSHVFLFRRHQSTHFMHAKAGRQQAALLDFRPEAGNAYYIRVSNEGIAKKTKAPPSSTHELTISVIGTTPREKLLAFDGWASRPTVRRDKSCVGSSTHAGRYGWSEVDCVKENPHLCRSPNGELELTSPARGNYKKCVKPNVFALPSDPREQDLLNRLIEAYRDRKKPETGFEFVYVNYKKGDDVVRLFRTNQLELEWAPGYPAVDGSSVLIWSGQGQDFGKQKNIDGIHLPVACRKITSTPAQEDDGAVALSVDLPGGTLAANNDQAQEACPKADGWFPAKPGTKRELEFFTRRTKEVQRPPATVAFRTSLHRKLNCKHSQPSCFGERSSMLRPFNAWASPWSEPSGGADKNCVASYRINPGWYEVACEQNRPSLCREPRGTLVISAPSTACSERCTGCRFTMPLNAAEQRQLNSAMENATPSPEFVYINYHDKLIEDVFLPDELKLEWASAIDPVGTSVRISADNVDRGKLKVGDTVELPVACRKKSTAPLQDDAGAVALSTDLFGGTRARGYKSVMTACPVVDGWYPTTPRTHQEFDFLTDKGTRSVRVGYRRKAGCTGGQASCFEELKLALCTLRRDAASTACHDGNNLSGDGCSATCQAEEYASCSTLHKLNPSLPSGMYKIDVDGNQVLSELGFPQSLPAFNMYCDMSSDPGWTMIVNTNGIGPAGQSSNISRDSGIPQRDGEARFMNPNVLRVLARGAARVKIQSPDGSKRIVSSPNTQPIINIREQEQASVDSTPADWAVVEGVESSQLKNVNDQCADSSGAGGYPNIYRACKASGLFISDSLSTWNRSSGVADKIEVYVGGRK